MSSAKQNTDVLVIGAGPSGCVAASIAHKLGHKVTVVEKTTFPRFVIGESLLPKCMEHLEEAGFLDVLKAQGYQEKHGAVFIKEDKRCLFNFAEQYTEGWKWTWQVPRAHFDKVLADEVQKMGVEVHFNSMVEDVKFDGTDSCTTVSDKDGNKTEYHAKYIIDASGFGRVLPRLLDLDMKVSEKNRDAIFAHFTDRKRPSGQEGMQITFIIHTLDVWVWIIPFSNGVTSVGIVGDLNHFDMSEEDKNKSLRKMLSEVRQLDGRFDDEDIVYDTKVIRAYAVSSKERNGPGFVITGNSSEFIDPVFSSGVTFATETGSLAAKLVHRELSGEQVDWKVEYNDFLDEGIDTLRTYVTNWYSGNLQDIFFYTSENSARFKMKDQICSVLAGYLWDKTNPFVKKHKKAVSSLSRVINMNKK